jgi:putative ABC transport system permease protein
MDHAWHKPFRFFKNNNMFKNYFKIAIAVLKRRKFFTFISLFGISFTLTILIVVTAFVDNMLSPDYPEVNRDRSLYVKSVIEKSSKDGNSRSNPPSFYFLNTYAAPLKSAEKVAISSFYSAGTTFVNDKKLVVNVKYTNAAWWDVLRYDFIEGRPYGQPEIGGSERVAVISESTKEKYFGDDVAAIGKCIEVDNTQYRVIGVVKTVPLAMTFSYADMYVPYTASNDDLKDQSLHGNYSAIILAPSRSDLPGVRDEFQQRISQVKTGDNEYDLLSCNADSYLESYTRDLLGNGTDSGVTKLCIIAGILLLIFMLLPTLNLVNINVSRILERSSEIGVRKAFGASSRTLVGQFIVENIILTVLGGIISVVLAFLTLRILNGSNLLPDTTLHMNYLTLLYSLVACLLFGFISGVYPAWRMSRLNIVSALKKMKVK